MSRWFQVVVVALLGLILLELHGAPDIAAPLRWLSTLGRHQEGPAPSAIPSVGGLWGMTDEELQRAAANSVFSASSPR